MVVITVLVVAMDGFVEIVVLTLIAAVTEDGEDDGGVGKFVLSVD